MLDMDDGGDETLSVLEAAHGKLPDTITAVTGGGGRHYVFKYPQGRSVPNKTKFAPGFDTRSTGGLIVATPSSYKSGNRYQWLGGHSSFNIPKPTASIKVVRIQEKNQNHKNSC